MAVLEPAAPRESDHMVSRLSELLSAHQNLEAAWKLHVLRIHTLAPPMGNRCMHMRQLQHTLSGFESENPRET